MTNTRWFELKRVRILLAGAAISLLAWTFRDADVSHVLELCAKLGVAGLLLVLLPQLVGILFDTHAFVHVLRALGSRASHHELLAIRVATEALNLCLPGGVVVAESLKVPLLSRRVRVPIPRAIAAIALRKYALILAQAAYLLLAALLAWKSFGNAELLPHWRVAPWIAAAALGLAVVAFATRFALDRATLGERARRLLARFRVFTSERGATEELPFAETDRELSRFFRAGAATELRISGWFGLVWLSEAVETFVLLRLLGADLSIGAVLGVEATLTLVRNVVFVLPAGLGVQDTGYALFLRALAVPDATEVAAAFTVLKRGKELLWTGVGLALLARLVPSRALSLHERPPGLRMGRASGNLPGVEQA